MLDFFNIFSFSHEEDKLGLDYRIDQRTGNKYTYINSLDQINSSYDVDAYIRSLLGNSYNKIAEIDGDAVVRLQNGNQVIFQDLDSDSLKKYWFGEQGYQECPYTISFKTASFHTYMVLTRKDTEQSFYFGIAQKVFGLVEGISCVRDEAYYEEMYYGGHKYHDPLDKNPLVNDNSSEILFDITTEQAVIIESVLKEQVSLMADDLVEYHFRYNNCMHFAQNLFEKIFNDNAEHFGAYYMADRIDLRDWGMYQIFVESNNMDWFVILQSPEYLLDLYHGDKDKKTTDKLLSDSYLGYKAHTLGYLLPNDMFGNNNLHINAVSQDDQLNINLLKDYDINSQNNLGETALLLAIENNNLNFAFNAIQLGADLCLTNNAGICPLHLVFNICAEASLKQLLINTSIMSASDVNIIDPQRLISPLISAVEANNLEAVKLLIDYGADVDVINLRKENIAYIAAENQSIEVYDYFAQEYEYLIYERPSLRTLKTAAEYIEAVRNGDDSIYINPVQLEYINFSDQFGYDWSII